MTRFECVRGSDALAHGVTAPQSDAKCVGGSGDVGTGRWEVLIVTGARPYIEISEVTRFE